MPLSEVISDVDGDVGACGKRSNLLNTVVQEEIGGTTSLVRNRRSTDGWSSGTRTFSSLSYGYFYEIQEVRLYESPWGPSRKCRLSDKRWYYMPKLLASKFDADSTYPTIIQYGGKTQSMTLDNGRRCIRTMYMTRNYRDEKEMTYRNYDFLRSLVEQYIRKECYRCKVNHSSQTHHQCVWTTEEDRLQICETAFKEETTLMHINVERLAQYFKV